jgi:hypothetical protein
LKTLEHFLKTCIHETFLRQHPCPCNEAIIFRQLEHCFLKGVNMQKVCKKNFSQQKKMDEVAFQGFLLLIHGQRESVMATG